MKHESHEFHEFHIIGKKLSEIIQKLIRLIRGFKKICGRIYICLIRAICGRIYINSFNSFNCHFVLAVAREPFGLRGFKNICVRIYNLFLGMSADCPHSCANSQA